MNNSHIDGSLKHTYYADHTKDEYGKTTCSEITSTATSQMISTPGIIPSEISTQRYSRNE